MGRAERALAEGLERAGLPFEISPGEGAFYGPKIEFHVKDALKRSWQLGTIQFDPQPARALRARVHRARTARSTGRSCSTAPSSARSSASSPSTSSTAAGNFPVWLAPRQAIVLTVARRATSTPARSSPSCAPRACASTPTSRATSSAPRSATPACMRYPYMLRRGPQGGRGRAPSGVRVHGTRRARRHAARGAAAARLLTESVPARGPRQALGSPSHGSRQSTTRHHGGHVKKHMAMGQSPVRSAPAAARVPDPSQPPHPRSRGPRHRRRRRHARRAADPRSPAHGAGAGARPRRGEPQGRPAGLQDPRLRQVQVRGEEEGGEAKRKQTVVEIKEIKLRPKTDDHDIDFKITRGAPLPRGRPQGEVHGALPRPRDHAPREGARAARHHRQGAARTWPTSRRAR